MADSGPFTVYDQQGNPHGTAHGEKWPVGLDPDEPLEVQPWTTLYTCMCGRIFGRLRDNCGSAAASRDLFDHLREVDAGVVQEIRWGRVARNAARGWWAAVREPLLELSRDRRR